MIPTGRFTGLMKLASVLRGEETNHLYTRLANIFEVDAHQGLGGGGGVGVTDEELLGDEAEDDDEEEEQDDDDDDDDKKMEVD